MNGLIGEEGGRILAVPNQTNVQIHNPVYNFTQIPDQGALQQMVLPVRPSVAGTYISIGAIGYVMGIGLAFIAKPLAQENRSIYSLPVGCVVMLGGLVMASWNIGGELKSLPQDKSWCVHGGKLVGFMAASMVFAFTNYF